MQHSQKPTDNPNFIKWLVMAPLGLLFLGAGLSLMGEATIRKRDNRPWFWLGTAALAVFNAGVAIFGDAVKHRVLLELDEGRSQ